MTSKGRVRPRKLYHRKQDEGYTIPKQRYEKERKTNSSKTTEKSAKITALFQIIFHRMCILDNLKGAISEYTKCIVSNINISVCISL